MNKVFSRSVFKLKSGSPSYSPRGSAVDQHVGADSNAPMAAGVVHFRDSNIPFTLWYDEILMCHSVEKRFEIVIDEAVHSMEPGDMMWLPAGTSLIYRSLGTTMCFYAVTPSDYEAKRP